MGPSDNQEAELGRKAGVLCDCPLELAGSAGRLTDKAAVQLALERIEDRQACPLSSGTQCWVGGRCQVYQKPSHFPCGGLTRPDRAGDKA